MTAPTANLDALKELLQETNRGVLMTRRRDGGIQSSPMSLLGNDDGRCLIRVQVTRVVQPPVRPPAPPARGA